MAKKITGIILRIGISLTLLFFLLHQIDKKGFLEIFKNAHIGFLSTAFMLTILMYILCLFRWEMLLKGAEVHLPFSRVLSGFCGGVFSGLFLPSTIGGDVVRGFDLSRHSKKPKEVVASVLLDRLSGYVGMVIITLIALAYGYKFIQDKMAIIIILALSLTLAFILLALFNNFLFLKINNLFRYLPGDRLRLVLKDLHKEIHYFRHQKRTIFSNILLSLIIQAISPLVFYLTAVALGVNIKFIYFMVFVPVIGVITLLPVSIGGLGLRDATAIFFFTKVGLSKDICLAISLTNFILIFIIGCIGGIIYVFTLSTRRL